MAYRFVQGLEYGIRRGTLGIAVHMAEGGDGTVRWLARRAGETIAAWRTRVRGVSAHFVILSDGEVVQMVRWSQAAGSMNPADQSDASGFYRQAVIESVLGSLERDPNAYSLAVEITGFRAQGPSRAQVDALLELVAECRRRYPQLVGAYGHADQTKTKECPGTAPLMLEAWRAIGHGPFRAEDDDMEPIYSVPGRQSAIWPKGSTTFDSPTGTAAAGSTGADRRYELVGQSDATATPARYLVDGAEGGAPGRMRWIARAGMTGLRDESYNAGVQAASAAALDAKRS